MKLISTILLSVTLSLAGFASFANTSAHDTSTTTASTTEDVKHTSMSSNWMCTTNASDATTAKGKAADEAMEDKTKALEQSASKAFDMAKENCRDCTQITCDLVK